MRRLALIFGLILAVPAGLQALTPLTTVRQIRALTPQQAESGLPVELKAVVTYYYGGDYVLFVADKTGPIYIQTRQNYSFSPGDLVLVHGVTVGSFHTNVKSDDIHVIGKAALPKPAPVTFAQMMSGNFDCAYVTVKGKVLSATMQKTGGASFLLMRLWMNGGPVDIHMNHPRTVDPHKLLDSEVTLTGVAGARFDGAFQVVGAMLFVGSPTNMRLLVPALVDPANLPLTPIPRILSRYNADQNPRLRIRGTVTLFEDGSQMVVESGGRGALVHTYENYAGNPVEVGDVVDVTGFPDPNDYSESLDFGQYTPTSEKLAVMPQQVTWPEAFSGKYAFGLISIDGTLTDQARESSQDTLFVEADGHAFSAVLSHPGNSALRLPQYSVGSRIHVTGVCFIQSGFAWRTPVSFNLRLRSPNDVQVLRLASWWTVKHLLYVIGVLAAIILAALIWGIQMRRRNYEQTLQIRSRMRFEAERERRQAFLEKQRSRVLEAINSPMPLEAVLRMITGLISEQMGGVECWCELATGTIVGSRQPRSGEMPPAREDHRDILSGSGERLGELVLRWSQGKEPRFGSEMIEIGVSLAALAIDNRRLYESLVQRSEYDQLTEIPNRFLLESRLGKALLNASEHQRRFALIYIDLNRFKTVNDRFGHRVGDIYLQHVAKRLQDRLRGQDTLARVGGDEFIVLVPVVRDRTEAQEIASRLENCFDSPFHIDGHTMQASASFGLALYPDDGLDEEQLMHFADSAMYTGKQRASGLGPR